MAVIDVELTSCVQEITTEQTSQGVVIKFSNPEPVKEEGENNGPAHS